MRGKIGPDTPRTLPIPNPLPTLLSLLQSPARPPPTSIFLPPSRAPEGFPLMRASQISPPSSSSARSQNPLPHRASPSTSFCTTPPSTAFASCLPFASGCAAPSHQVAPPPHPATSPAVEPPHPLTIPPQSIPSSKPSGRRPQAAGSVRLHLQCHGEPADGDSPLRLPLWVGDATSSCAQPSSSSAQLDWQ
jgi:hypothetical protein